MQEADRYQLYPVGLTLRTAWVLEPTSLKGVDPLLEQLCLGGREQVCAYLKLPNTKRHNRWTLGKEKTKQKLEFGLNICLSALSE